jgi:metallo-beta-lactamase family protein
MKIKFLGAAGTVTGSKFHIEHRGCHVLVDCGLFQGPRELRELNREPLPFSDFTAVILTHAHVDHSGYLPRLVKDGFRKKVHATHATYELCKILLLDAAKLQEEDADYADKTRYSRHFPAEPLFTTFDAIKSLDLFISHDYNQWIKLSDFMSFRFVRNGHILGSAAVQIQYSDDVSSKIITFTGDLGGGRSQVIKEPDYILETDYLITESTYGDRALKPLDEDALALLINKVFNREGTLIVPAFSVGRTQEILYIIKKLQNAGKISTQIPVYLDSPMAIKASTAYVKFPNELKLSIQEPLPENFFQPSNFRMTESGDESMLLCMSEFPKVVISASGMLQGGRVMHHLKAKLGNEKNAVLFTGYQGKGTKGLLLKSGLNKIRLHHKEIDVEAEIVVLDSLSAHADSNELMTWYKKLTKAPQKVFIVHGEEEAQRALKYRIEKELGWSCEIPLQGQELALN